jgi:hypothetical protein
MSETFLCGNCKREMCTDCRLMAEEYQMLLEKRTQALIAAQDTNERMTRELVNTKRRADMWEQVSKAGLPDVILAWMDKDINKLLRKPSPQPGDGDGAG